MDLARQGVDMGMGFGGSAVEEGVVSVLAAVVVTGRREREGVVLVTVLAVVLGRGGRKDGEAAPSVLGRGGRAVSGEDGVAGTLRGDAGDARGEAEVVLAVLEVVLGMGLGGSAGEAAVSVVDRGEVAPAEAGGVGNGLRARALLLLALGESTADGAVEIVAVLGVEVVEEEVRAGREDEGGMEEVNGVETTVTEELVFRLVSLCGSLARVYLCLHDHVLRAYLQCLNGRTETFDEQQRRPEPLRVLLKHSLFLFRQLVYVPGQRAILLYYFLFLLPWMKIRKRRKHAYAQSPTQKVRLLLAAACLAEQVGIGVEGTEQGTRWQREPEGYLCADMRNYRPHAHTHTHTHRTREAKCARGLARLSRWLRKGLPRHNEPG